MPVKTECMRGHAMTPDNIYTSPKKGVSECLTCKKDRAKPGWKARQVVEYLAGWEKAMVRDLGLAFVPVGQDHVSVIDIDDVAVVSQFRWFHDGTHGYAVTSSGSGPRQSQPMHRVIMEAREGYEIDHRDQNKLNNRRENLRYATHQQNMANVGLARNNTSGFKGVCYSKAERKYVASIRKNGRQTRIGAFPTPEEAARAYDREAILHFGREFAWLNFPEDHPT